MIAAPSCRQRLFASLRRVAGLLGLAYVGFAGWVYWNQETLLFRGEPLPAGHRFDLPADIREVGIPVPGATLSALHLRVPGARGVVFYLHGNGGNLDSWFSNHDFYRQAGIDLFMIDYRGYGKSSGRPQSEAQLLADVRAAWATVAPQYAGRTRVIVGRSLGSGLAARLAAEVQPELTVLISPYCSLREVAAAAYPYLPGFLLRYPLDTCAVADGIRGPLLLIHGDRDTLIPAEHSRRIQARAPRAELALIAGAGHDDVHGFESYRQTLRARLLLPGPRSAQEPGKPAGR